MRDLYASTPHSGSYYHTAATCWANGALNLLTASGDTLSDIIWMVRAEFTPLRRSVGALNATVYNAASQPTQIIFASLDNDTFTCGTNTDRMTQYKFNIMASP